MTDRELLENAAKAAGIEGTHVVRFDGVEGILSPDEDCFWRPLTDDGDALRLAVKLGLWVRRTRRTVFVETPYEDLSREAVRSDPYAAARRAIVRAAAEIGRRRAG